MRHIPVMLEESLKVFEGQTLSCFFDATVGAGGFAKELLKSHPEIEVYYACDRDASALEIARGCLKGFEEKVLFIHRDFKDLKEVLSETGVTQVDGFFFDFGMSSMQLDDPKRGFSFLRDGELDMRMDRSQGITAREILQRWSQKALESLFRMYEVPQWKKVAGVIVAARKKKMFDSTVEFAKMLSDSLRKTRKHLHPATLVFQALRIQVNEELESIEKAVKDALDHLKPKKRLAALSFHSLEDRIVKTILRDAARGVEQIQGRLRPTIKIVTKKPLFPSGEEITRNTRARSAKLRIAEKI